MALNRNDRIDSYIDQGYLVIENLLNKAEVEELKTDILRIARGSYPCEEFQTLDPGLSDEAALGGFIAIHHPHEISPVIKRYCQHPAISSILGDIVGAHLPHWDGRVKCMQSMFFTKSPGSPGQAWHQDELYIPTRDRSLTGAWIAVDDADIDNGCLWVIPGTHRDGYLYDQEPIGDTSEFDGKPESVGFDETQEVPVEVPSGSVVFFNGHLLHRSKKNRSDRYRRALVNHYMNAWSRLPWFADPDLTISRTDTRNVFMVNGEDPYAHKGYTQSRVYLRKSAEAESKAGTNP